MILWRWSEGRKEEKEPENSEAPTPQAIESIKNEPSSDIPQNMGEISSWAKEAMAWALDQGLLPIPEEGILEPKGPLSRAEIAEIMMRYITAEQQ